MYISKKKKSLNTKKKAQARFLHSDDKKKYCDIFLFGKTLHSLVVFCFQTASQHPPVSLTVLLFLALKLDENTQRVIVVM